MMHPLLFGWIVFGALVLHVGSETESRHISKRDSSKDHIPRPLALRARPHYLSSNAVSQKITEGANDMFKRTANVRKTIAEPLGGAVAKLEEMPGRLVNKGSNAAGKLFSQAKKAVDTRMQRIKIPTQITNFGTNVKNKFEMLETKSMEKVKSFGEAVDKKLEKTFGTNLGGVGAAGAKAVQETVNEVKNAVSSIVGDIRTRFEDTLRKEGEAFKKGLQKEFKDLKNAVLKDPTKVFVAVKKFASNVFNFVKGTIGKLVQNAKNFLKGAFNNFKKNAVEAMKKLAGAIVDKIVNLIKEKIMQVIKEKIIDVIKQSIIKAVIDAIRKMIAKLIAKVIAKAIAAALSAIPLVGGLAGQIAEAAAGATAELAGAALDSAEAGLNAAVDQAGNAIEGATAPPPLKPEEEMAKMVLERLAVLNEKIGELQNVMREENERILEEISKKLTETMNYLVRQMAMKNYRKLEGKIEILKEIGQKLAYNATIIQKKVALKMCKQDVQVMEVIMEYMGHLDMAENIVTTKLFDSQWNDESFSGQFSEHRQIHSMMQFTLTGCEGRMLNVSDEKTYFENLKQEGAKRFTRVVKSFAKINKRRESEYWKTDFWTTDDAKEMNANYQQFNWRGEKLVEKFRYDYISSCPCENRYSTYNDDVALKRDDFTKERSDAACQWSNRSHYDPKKQYNCESLLVRHLTAQMYKDEYDKITKAVDDVLANEQFSDVDYSPTAPPFQITDTSGVAKEIGEKIERALDRKVFVYITNSQDTKYSMSDITKDHENGWIIKENIKFIKDPKYVFKGYERKTVHCFVCLIDENEDTDN